MESILVQISEIAGFVIDAAWLPLVIWTLISFMVWMLLQASEKIHPEYHYHTRLALIFALPAGLIFLAAAELISNFFETTADSGLVFISVMSPIDISVTQAEESAGLPITSMVYIAIFLLFCFGLLIYSARFINQCIKLNRLRNQCSLIPITEIEHLNSTNLGLAMATRKTVKVAFMSSEIIPVTFGFRKPVILLPESLRNDTEKLNLAIRHELTHITQHDFFSHMLVTVTESFFWFHPFVHRLRRELIEYREMRCDNLVLTETSVSRKKYASLLLELIPKTNIDKDLSVNMAQESSNLKKRISMITQQTTPISIPKRSSLFILAAIFISTTLVMACTDMQTQNVFDEEDLNLMTNIDRTGEQGFHEVIIFMSEENQAEKHESKLAQLRMLEPEHIQSIDIWKGDQAVERYGERGSEGVIIVKTKLDAESYNTTMKALGMNEVNPEELAPASGDDDIEDFFVVVEDMPELIGGLESIQRDIRYPQTARQAGIEGRVYIQFIVNEEGDVEKPKVIRGIGGGADEEALRVVRQAKFKPGLQRGQPVRVQYALPILFKLAGSENTPEQSFAPTGNLLDDMTVVGYGSGNSTSGSVEPQVIYKELEVNLKRLGSKIQGQVLDKDSGQPLPGTNIILEGTSNGTTTGQNGEFTLDNVSTTDSPLIISYVGYQTARMNLEHAEP